MSKDCKYCEGKKCLNLCKTDKKKKKKKEKKPKVKSGKG